MALTITVEGLTIAGVEGAPPTSQSATSVTFEGPVRDVTVKAQPTAGLRAVMRPAADPPETADAGGIRWLLVMLAPWLVLIWAAQNGGRRWMLRTAGIGTAVTGAPLMKAIDYTSLQTVGAPASAVVLGLLWSPVTLAALTLIHFSTDSRRWIAQAITVAVCAVLLLPIGYLIEDPSRIAAGHVGVWNSIGELAMTALSLANLALAAGILVFLARADEQSPRACLLAIAVVVIAVPTRLFGLEDVLTVLVAVAAFVWVLPFDRQEQAVRLSRVSPEVHSRLLFAESWRRLAERAGHQHFRAARQRMAEEPGQDDALRAAQLRLDRSTGLLRRRTPTGIYLPKAALGSSAGWPAGANALWAVAAGLLLAFPLAAYELYRSEEALSFVENLATSQSLTSALPVFRWAAYAFVFGYFYPWLRGQQPVSKALALLFPVASVEVVRLLGTLDGASLEDFAIATAIRVGQAAVFCLGLGLLWERRIVRAGGLRWARIRDFRTLQALGAPLTTVIVAGLTTVATALAGAAVMAMLTPPPQPGPGPQVSPSAGAGAR